MAGFPDTQDSNREGRKRKASTAEVTPAHQDLYNCFCCMRVLIMAEARLLQCVKLANVCCLRRSPSISTWVSGKLATVCDFSRCSARPEDSNSS